MSVVGALLFELERAKRLGERALAQLDESEWHWKPDADANSVAIQIQHLHGNMVSRWTDFLTADGEKPTRQRDAEFEDQGFDPAKLRELWEEGWECCLGAIRPLTDEDLARTITIRNEPLSALEAILRQVSHYSYHVGQLVWIARMRKGPGFSSLTIPRGKSAEHTSGSYKPDRGSEIGRERE